MMQEEGVLKGQELENAIVDADYTKAIRLAFELRRPHKLLELFLELCRFAILPLFFLPIDVGILLIEYFAGREELKIRYREPLML